MKRDLGWYIGFIFGAACTGLLIQYTGVELHGIVRLILVIGVGAGCGWLMETLLQQRSR